MSVFGPVVPNLFITPEQFGAKGDGVTNDTAAMQRALDALADGDALILRDGSTYLVDNLTHPSRANRGVTIRSVGRATIKSSGLGNTDYLLASVSYVNNNTFVSWSLTMENITIDANSTKDKGLALATAYSRIINCQFIGANVYGCYLTETTIDGVTNCPSVVDNAFIQCSFHNNPGSGFGCSDLVADYQIYGGNSRTNGAYGIYATSCAGMQISTFTTYNNTSGNHFAGYGFSTSITGCTFDDTTEIASMDGTNQKSQFGPGNTLKNHRLVCTLGGAGSPVFLAVTECRFQGSGAGILHNYNALSRTVFIDGGTSDDVNPVLWNFASPSGIVIARNHWSGNGNGFLNGRLNPLPNTASGATSVNTPTSVLKNLTAGVATTVVIALSLPTAQYSGSSLTVRLSVLTVETGFTVVKTYTGYVDAATYRIIGSATNANHALVRDESSSAGSGISAAAVWGVTGGAGDQTATLTITITHAVPSGVGSTTLRAEVQADHRNTTAMTMV